MRILYVCDALAICGGIERVLVEKANWLVRHADYEVCLLTVNQGTRSICFPLYPDVSCDDLNIQFHQQYHVPFWRRPFITKHLHSVFRNRMYVKIKEFAPHVIVCTRLDYIRDILQVKGNVPLVFESHSSSLATRFEGNGLLRRFHVSYFRRCVRMLAYHFIQPERRTDCPDSCSQPFLHHVRCSGYDPRRSFPADRRFLHNPA